MPRSACAFTAAVLGLIALSGCAVPEADPLPASTQAAPPYGYTDLCRRAPAFCVETGQSRKIPWSEALAADLKSVTSAVNKRVTYRTDPERTGKTEHWEVAGDAGDCEDYALAKMRALERRGYPRSALRLAIARRQRDDQLHAVLLVETTRGTYALDSSYHGVYPWNSLPYTNWRWEAHDHEDWARPSRDAPSEGEVAAD